MSSLNNNTAVGAACGNIDTAENNTNYNNLNNNNNNNMSIIQNQDGLNGASCNSLDEMDGIEWDAESGNEDDLGLLFWDELTSNDNNNNNINNGSMMGNSIRPSSVDGLVDNSINGNSINGNSINGNSMQDATGFQVMAQLQSQQQLQLIQGTQEKHNALSQQGHGTNEVLGDNGLSGLFTSDTTNNEPQKPQHPSTSIKNYKEGEQEKNSPATIPATAALASSKQEQPADNGGAIVNATDQQVVNNQGNSTANLLGMNNFVTSSSFAPSNGMLNDNGVATTTTNNNHIQQQPLIESGNAQWATTSQQQQSQALQQVIQQAVPQVPPQQPPQAQQVQAQQLMNAMMLAQNSNNPQQQMALWLMQQQLVAAAQAQQVQVSLKVQSQVPAQSAQDPNSVSQSVPQGQDRGNANTNNGAVPSTKNPLGVAPNIALNQLMLQLQARQQEQQIIQQVAQLQQQAANAQQKQQLPQVGIMQPTIAVPSTPSQHAQQAQTKSPALQSNNTTGTVGNPTKQGGGALTKKKTEATIVHTASPQAKLPAAKTAVVAPAVGTSSMLQGQGHPGSSQAPRPITATLFPTMKNATALMPNTALSASGMIAPNNAFPIVSASDTDGTTIAHQPPRKKAKRGGGGSFVLSSTSAGEYSATDDDQHLTEEEQRLKHNRERNREHAKNTRIRKKAYVERLKMSVDELCRERDSLVSERATSANLLVEIHSKRVDVLRSFFALRASYNVNQRRELWSSILDESSITCRLPVTPYQSFPSSEVQVSNCQRTIVGVDAMIGDAAANYVFLDSIVDRGRYPDGKIKFQYTLVTEESVVSGNQLMARWAMSTLNAKKCGANTELHQRGMLICKFNSAHKIVNVEIMFDVMAFMLQVKMAMGFNNFNDVVIPNTVQTCGQKVYDYPMVMTLANRPYTIVQVNERWENLTGYKGHEVVGKRSCSILQQSGTTATSDEAREKSRKEINQLMGPVLFQRPSCAMITNYTKSGRRYRQYVTIYPLSTDSNVTHYLGLTTFVQWIENAKSEQQQSSQKNKVINITGTY